MQIKELFLASIGACLFLTAARADAVTFTTPSFAGQPGSTFQEWQGFTSPPGPNAPTTSSNLLGTANWFDRTADTDGAFNIGDAPHARIYSPDAAVNPQIDVPLYNLGPISVTTLVLQTEVSGHPLDTATFLATPSGGSGFAPSSINFTSTPGTRGSTFDYTVVWNDLPAASAYTLTYSPNDASSSQAGARVDTLSALVPEPGSLGILAVGALGLLARRRRRRSA